MNKEDVIVFRGLMKEVMTEVLNDVVIPRLDRLEERMDSLEARMDSLEARMDKLEDTMNNEVLPRLGKLEDAMNNEVLPRLGKLEDTMSDEVLPRLSKIENMMSYDMIPKLNVIIEGEDLLLTKYEFNIRISKVEFEVQKITPIIDIVSRHSEILSNLIA